MNVIFVTISRITGIANRGIYADLMRKFRDEGHQVHIVTSSERRFGESTSLKEVDGVKILNVRILNIQKTNVVEKGISTLLVERQYQKAIKKYFADVSFDLILYSTPPITFNNVVRYLKRHNPKAISYLLLKDIFPQNAVDLGMFSKQSPFYWFFRRKETTLYKNSDFIGCMSPANVEYLKRHNPDINPETVEIAPNSIEILPCKAVDKGAVRAKYGLPADKPLLIYGGNLGKPQGIPFMVECLKANSHRSDCHFIIVGNGTEYRRVESWVSEDRPSNVTLMQRLPKEDYDLLVSACDVGLIFLDHRFTIPNYPSRLLPYLEYGMPVIACTDVNTDIGRIAEANGYGLACESTKTEDFTRCLDRVVKMGADGLREMGMRGRAYLESHHDVSVTYRAVMSHFGKR